MRLKNYMEDVVTDVLDILLKERDGICKCKQCKTDIIAFALNRLPPKYIVSERGFTHSYIEEINNVDWKTDVISVVNLGIDIVSKRQRHFKNNFNDKFDIVNNPEQFFKIEKNRYYYNFPHLIGQVLDRDSFKPLNNVKVSLYLDEKLAESSEKSWANPYITNEATQGFYSFWPKALVVNEPVPEAMKFKFKLLYSLEDYHKYTKEFYILIEPDEYHYRFIRRNYTEKIDLTTLEKRRR